MSRSSLVVSGVIIAILLITIGILGWKYYQVSNNTEKNTKETSERIVRSVGELYLTPTDEEPTVAQIQDKDKLGNQDFFKNARNGDYLLVYQKNKIALVYRENDDKLVNVGPVNIEANPQQTPNTQNESSAP